MLANETNKSLARRLGFANPDGCKLFSCADGRFSFKTVTATVGIAFGILAIAVVFAGVTAESDQSAQAPPSAATKPLEPPLANVTLRAYDLLKNPFGYRNHIIALSVTERPVMYDNSVIQYADIGGADPRVASQMGLTGVRLNRMLFENIALYDIDGLNANYNSDSQVLGQLVVVLPVGRTELEMGRYWDVEPLGVVDGTNGFGAEIQVPQVRFWRYTDERSRSTQELSGDARMQ